MNPERRLRPVHYALVESALGVAAGLAAGLIFGDFARGLMVGAAWIIVNVLLSGGWLVLRRTRTWSNEIDE